VVQPLLQDQTKRKNKKKTYKEIKKGPESRPPGDFRLPFAICQPPIRIRTRDTTTPLLPPTFLPPPAPAFSICSCSYAQAPVATNGFSKCL
jgi:hypothetical protein